MHKRNCSCVSAARGTSPPLWQSAAGDREVSPQSRSVHTASYDIWRNPPKSGSVPASIFLIRHKPLEHVGSSIFKSR